MSELYIGLMSGTSMDAIDAALVDFTQGVRLLGTYSLPLPTEIRQRLTMLCQSGPDEIERMGRIDSELGQLFAAATLALLHSSEHHSSQIKAIGSHGQTIRHRPLSQPPFTLQIGDPNVIAERTGITVVADFRRRDMAAGGQGAPLVPAFHASVFSSPQRHRIVLNLGGIANITIIPAGRPEATFGFDTGPANTLMDSWCLHRKGEPFDKGGEWAASGDIDPALLERLLSHPYFSRLAPKSTGREDFHLPWLQEAIAAEHRSISDENIQATLLELTAHSIAAAIANTGLGQGELLLCGGGINNTALQHRLQALLPSWSLHSTADFGLAPSWVEATAFAWLARQTLLGLPGNLASVTGAVGPRILGGIYPA
jgi:anhydro-N-acetylmuramic acid kinase